MAERALDARDSDAPVDAGAIWSELASRPSVRGDRVIRWPTPAPLKRAPLEEAHVQLSDGYLADAHFARVSELDWSKNPFRDKSWSMRLMCLQPADAYFYAYDITGDPVWLERARDIVLSWCDFHVRQGRRAYLSWQDMAVGYRALKLALLVDKTLNGELTLEADHRRLLVEAADAHVVELMRPETLSQGNHGIFQMHGLAVLAQVLWPLPSAAEAMRYARDTLAHLVRRQFNDEGVHLEHSPHYHKWMLDELRDMFGSGWHVGTYIGEVSERAEEVKHWLCEPDGHPVRIGDTAIASRWPQPKVPPRPDVETAAYRLRVFPKGGYAICRADDAQLFFHAAYHSKAHKHADDLHFDLFDLGRRILVDAGAHGYKISDERAYLLSTRAHNTVEVDDTSYPRDGTDAFGSALEPPETFQDRVRLSAAVDHASLGVRHARTLDYTPGRRLLIEDRLGADRPRRFVQWLHLAPAFDRVDEDAFSDGEVTVWIRSAAPRRLHRGETAPLLGWRAAEIGRLEPCWSIGFEANGSEATLQTAIEFSRVVTRR